MPRPTLPLLLALGCLVAPVARTAADDHVPSSNTEPRSDAPMSTNSAPLDRTMNDLAGKPVDLNTYSGKVVLIVNTASECGLTPQYAGLQELHESYGSKGLAILGFPCNQFGGQEPGTADQIHSFCQKNYGVSFDMFEKIEVNGDGAHDLYKTLTTTETQPAPAGPITWNFEKFLLGRDGAVLHRFSPKTTPKDPDLVAAIEGALGN